MKEKLEKIRGGVSGTQEARKKAPDVSGR